MLMKKLWKWPMLALFRGHAPCPGCHLQVELTGESPGNPAEELVKKIVGSRRLVPFHWLEERIAEALYYTALRQGTWVIDIGLWGPAAFHREATRILVGMRPKFGFLTEENENTQRLQKIENTVLDNRQGLLQR